MNMLIPTAMKNRVLGCLLVCWALFQDSASFGQSNIVYPAGGGSAIIYVTKPPYNADNTGRTDCTDALNRAYDDVLRRVLNSELATERVLAAHPDTLIGQESGAVRGCCSPPKHRLRAFCISPMAFTP